MNARVEKILNLPVYQRFLIVIVVMALLVSGFYFTVYKSQIDEHNRLISQRKSAQTQLLKNQKIANNLEVYRAEFEKMELLMDKALSELPLEQEIPSLLTGIADLAREKGLDILRFKPSGETIKDFYAEVPVDLKMTGSYHEAAVFFDAVRQMERIVNINGLTLTGPKKSEGKTLVSVNCQAVTYRFVENAPDQNGSKKNGGKKK
jgi:type IV pilus assembly protein PilO